jgi:hypothetical protein
MASAGTVTVDFAAETAKFTAELKKVRGDVAGLQGSFSSLERTAGLALKVFGGAQLLGFAKQAFDAADATADAAARAGIAVDSFSRLQYAATQADVEIGAFTSGITKFQVEISKAADGSKNAGDTLKQFGISAAVIRNLRIEDQLALVADAFVKIENPADRTRLAIELFGKAAGPQLVPLLAQGRAGIAELLAESDRLGATMSQQTAEGIAVADAALKRLKATLSGFTTRTMGGLALMIEDALAAVNGSTGSPLIELQKQQNDLLEKRRAAMEAIQRLEAQPATGMFSDVRNESLAKANQELVVASDLLQIVNGKLQDMGREALAIETAANAVASEKERLGSLVQEIDLAPIQALKIEIDDYKLLLEEIWAGIEANRQKRVDESLDIVGTGFADAQADVQARITADLEAQLQERTNLSAYYADLNKRNEEAAQQAIIDARNDALNAGIDALQAYAGGSKSAAKALVAINKARAIASAIMNTYEGATLQLTSGDPYTATFRAAAVVAFGLAQVAAIVKSGQGEVGAINAHGGAPAGSPSNPVYTRPPASTDEANTKQGAGQSVIALHVHGNYFGSRETVDYLMSQFREQINTRDVVLFSSDSRQAQELAPA